MKHICVLFAFFTVFISCASEPVDIPDPIQRLRQQIPDLRVDIQVDP